MVSSHTGIRHLAVWCRGSDFNRAQERFPLAKGQSEMDNALLLVTV
jgi:hypothetical protein